MINIPIRWYVLEMSLKEVSSRLNRKVLSKQECLEVAKQIHIEKDALVDALKLFHKQHIFTTMSTSCLTLSSLALKFSWTS